MYYSMSALVTPGKAQEIFDECGYRGRILSADLDGTSNSLHISVTPDKLIEAAQAASATLTEYNPSQATSDILTLYVCETVPEWAYDFVGNRRLVFTGGEEE